jgi:MoxR-like ATPase
MNQPQFSEKAKIAISQLERGLVGRGLQCRLVLLALLAGEHSLLIGPPGTAKSLLAKRLHKLIDIPPEINANNLDNSAIRNLRSKGYFEVLLTNFSTPEEVLGPLSIPELQNNVYKRITEGYLPSASIAFLDEIFKANSAILNALLTIINEREFDNGAIRYPVPLLSVIGASNELPREVGELGALFDRFLVRLWVNNLDNQNFVKLLGIYDQSSNNNNISKTNPIFSISELQALQESIDSVILPNFIKVYFAEFRIKLENMNQEIRQKRNGNSQNVNINLQDTSFREAYVSERRWGKIVKLLKTSAFLNNRNYISIWDLLLLPECVASAKDHVEEFPRKLLVDWSEVVNQEVLSNPLPLPTEEDLRRLSESEFIEYHYQLLVLQGDLCFLRDLNKSLAVHFNEYKNASINIWLTSNEFKNRLKEWGKNCSDSTVIQAKLTTLEEQWKSYEKILQSIEDGTKTTNGGNGGNDQPIITDEIITCSVGDAEIVFVKVNKVNNDGGIYISEIPITLNMLNDIQGQPTIRDANANRIMTMTIPEIETFMTQINKIQSITVKEHPLTASFRLPTRQEYKTCVLGTLNIQDMENLVNALNQDKSKIYHRGSRLRLNDNDYLQQVKGDRRTLNFCSYLKSPVGYQPQLCTINNQQNKYISVGGSKNSSIQEIGDSIIKGKTIDDNNINSQFSFRLILKIHR